MAVNEVLVELVAHDSLPDEVAEVVVLDLPLLGLLHLFRIVGLLVSRLLLIASDLADVMEQAANGDLLLVLVGQDDRPIGVPGELVAVKLPQPLIDVDAVLRQTARFRKMEAGGSRRREEVGLLQPGQERTRPGSLDVVVENLDELLFHFSVPPVSIIFCSALSSR